MSKVELDRQSLRHAATSSKFKSSENFFFGDDGSKDLLSWYITWRSGATKDINYSVVMKIIESFCICSIAVLYYTTARYMVMC